MKGLLIGFALFALLTAVLVVVGVLTHTEAGLLEVCWKNNVAHYDGCEQTEELRWSKSQFPLRVGVRAYSHMDSDQAQGERAVRSAVELWNGRLGFPAMRFVGTEVSDVLVVWGMPSEGAPAEGGACTHRRVGGAVQADVSIVDVGLERLSYRITVHELGHALGLAHDDFEASPMYPVTRDDTWDERMAFVRPTDHDVELLRGLYQ